MDSVKDAAIGKIPSGVDAFMMLSYETQKSSKQVFETFKNLQNIVLHSLIGLDHLSYIRYKRVTRLIYVGIMGDGRLSVNFAKDNVNPDDVDFVIHFVIDSVIQIESLVDDIDDPFGHNKWWKEDRN